MKANYVFKICTLLCIMLTLTVTSCRKNDDTEKKTSNFIEYKGQQDDITKGVINFYGKSDGEGFNFDIILASPNMHIDSESGNGSIIFFELFSGSETELQNGTYTYEQSYNAFTFDEGSFLFKFNTDEDSGYEDDIKSGSISITHIDEVYTIDFLCIDNGGNSIKGNYSGTLHYSDFSQIKAGKIKYW